MNKTHQKGFSEILASVRNDGRRRLAAKVPQWAGWAERLRIPLSLNLEQCTCGEAARYKAALSAGILADRHGDGSKKGRIADLTGGLGVDAQAFSLIAGKVLHNERDASLSEAVASNFRLMGTDNVVFSNFDIGADGDAHWLRFLKDFAPDIIYADPARRDGSGRKVFLPADCSPDIVKLMPSLLETAGTVMVKFSPLMDISALETAFSGSVSQIHIVSSGGEVKEVLGVFSGNSNGRPELFISGDDCEAGQVLAVNPGDESRSTATFPSDAAGIRQFTVLFEPGSGLLKAGLFKYPAERFGMVKLAPSTHLYLCREVVPELAPYGKFFRILGSLPFCKNALKKLAQEYPHADVSARNIPLSSDALRSRMGIRPGPNPQSIHVFAATVSMLTGREKMLFYCSSHLVQKAASASSE